MDATKKPGRPRDSAVEERILAVALRLLAEEGYSRMSLDAVAIEAGVSKPTIYRRWSSKADLATAAIRTLQLAEPTADASSLPGELTAILENFCRSLMRPNGMSLIGTVLAEEAHTPELLRLFRERLVTPRRAMLRAVLKRAQAQNLLREGMNLESVVSTLVGAFYGRYLAGSQIPAAFPREVVDVVWRGIAK